MASEASNLLSKDNQAYKAVAKLLSRRDYPEVFERVAESVGGVKELAQQLQLTLKRKKEDLSTAYEHICRWPIRCYLTTNYDDEISRHLAAISTHFTVCGNSKAEMSQITADTSRRIYKLHGDLIDPSGLVLTTSQYTDFEHAGERKYLRDKLVSIFQMVPVLVVGHSMEDRDFQSILRIAKQCASPQRPIYMIVDDTNSDADATKLYREFNIRLIAYPNPDGSYRHLDSLLRQIDRFVVPRTDCPQPPLDLEIDEDAAKAVSLYVHQSLGFGSESALLQRAIQPQILSLSAEDESGIVTSDIKLRLLPISMRLLPSIDAEITEALASLEGRGVVTRKKSRITAKQRGLDALAESEAKRSAQEDQFFGAIAARLRGYGSDEDIEKLVDGLRAGLVQVFQKRGLAAAEVLFKDGQFVASDMPQVFDAVFPPATLVTDYALRTEYCDAVMDILTQPNDEQRSFLANLAQGFFAYHMFGLDPSGQEIRAKMVQDTLWLLDSNILMPLAAKHCEEHDYIAGMLQGLLDLGVVPITTPKLVSEVDRALGWLERKLQGVRDGEERSWLQAITSDPEYSDNPFLDAFINGQVAGNWRTMTEFLEAIRYVKGTGLRDAIEECGVEVVDPESIYKQASAEIEELSRSILEERTQQGTVRAGERQAKAEAEVLHVLRTVRDCGFRGNNAITRAFFVSTSRLLDSMYRGVDGVLTWYPETLKSHLTYLNGGTTDPAGDFRGITTAFYSAGISIVDKSAYKEYFKPSITESTARLHSEVDSYAKAVSASVAEEQSTRESILKSYASLPDLEKPTFVEQMGWQAARTAQSRVKNLEREKADIERKGKEEVALLKAEFARKERERERHKQGHLKNLMDPKHQAKLRRQAKKRSKRKKR